MERERRQGCGGGSVGGNKDGGGLHFGLADVVTDDPCCLSCMGVLAFISSNECIRYTRVKKQAVDITAQDNGQTQQEKEGKKEERKRTKANQLRESLLY